ncbi:unnamed protein product [Euphydryas editha]|uniref:Uncharacterized protein n=1 Tax=Euphydryas editha TaxID=104508 RepID=A0AAU9UC27_EUPED|nr:unnamed protein product [Euphydryas editha]CAH2097171.1 unnamed protein product [Euphydryas editha]
MPHITDQLWQSVLQLLTNAKYVHTHTHTSSPCSAECRTSPTSCGRACCSCSPTPSMYTRTHTLARRAQRNAAHHRPAVAERAAAAHQRQVCTHAHTH